MKQSYRLYKTKHGLIAQKCGEIDSVKHTRPELHPDWW